MKNRHSISKQQGAALFISMTMLFLVTIIVLTAARVANLELIMGVNTQNAAIALMRAENSSFDGEERINDNFGGAPTFDFSQIQDDGLYLDDEINLNTVNWTEVSAEAFYRQGQESIPMDPGNVQNPEQMGDNFRQYVIEYVGPGPMAGGSLAIGAGGAMGRRYLYRVSGRGSANRRSTRVVQTIFATVE
jgi:Tfp pilus assembly protein PilX